MKINHFNEKFSGNWHRDCELCNINYKSSYIEIYYYKHEDSTNWKITFDSFIAFKIITEELGGIGDLSTLPVEGAFYELFESSWLTEIVKTGISFVEHARHFVLCFYEEKIEVISNNFKAEKVVVL